MDNYSLPLKLRDAIQNLGGKFPYYIFDQTNIKRDLQKLKDSFQKYPTEIGYSYKTNYILPLVKYLDNEGVFSEVVSSFEVDLVEEFGIGLDKIIFNGPVKSTESIFKVLNSGGLVNADSFDDLKLIANVILKNPQLKKPRIGIRVRFNKEGFESRFGITANKKNINEVKIILKELGIEFLSCVHMHYPNRSLAFFRNKVEAFSKFICEIKDLININETMLDIGGGLPSNMPLKVLESLGISDYALSDYGKILNELREKYKLTNFKFIIEPGTCLAANALHLVGNIRTINYSNKKTNVNTDISKSLLGGLSQKAIFPMEIIISEALKNKNKNLIKKPIYFSGFTCVEDDVFGYEEEKSLYLEVGDKIILYSVGSYSAVFKSPFINGDISLYIWDGYQLLLSRSSQTANDIFSKYLF